MKERMVSSDIIIDAFAEALYFTTRDKTLTPSAAVGLAAARLAMQIKMRDPEFVTMDLCYAVENAFESLISDNG